MKSKSRSFLILGVLFGYVILQFLWWEILLVKQAGQIINEKQKIVELSVADAIKLKAEVADLHHKKATQTIMIVGEGTVFLLILLFGVYKIKQAHDKETELTRQQNNFFLSITHELKTPIAATKLQLQTLQKQQLSPDIQKELITNALKENDRLNALIDNVLFASRMEAGQFDLKLQKQNLNEIILQICKRYYNKELENGELLIHGSENCIVNLDEAAITSILCNLIDNAIKYSPNNKMIELSLIKKENFISLFVADRGIGIGAGEKEKIFDKFYRVGNEEMRRTKGTGLGLYIVKKLLQGHSAKISLKDNLPLGTVFEIKFHAA